MARPVSGKWKTGSLVRLALPGTPSMIVKGYAFPDKNPSTLVTCQWFVGGILYEGTFQDDCLTAVEESRNV
jgi:uncharacterized protein YodC (DUF2158 family)